MISVGCRKLDFTEKLEPYFIETIDKQGTTKTLTMKDCGYVKELVFDVVIFREFFSPSGEPRKWFGLQECVAKIPNERSYRYIYLFKSKDMDNIAITFVDPLTLDNFGTHSMVTTLVDISDGQYIRKVGSAKKLTIEQVRLKLKNREILGIYRDDLKSQPV